MGRPKKRDSDVVKVSKAMGISLSADILSVADLDGFPAFDGLSNDDKAMLCLSACGFGQLFIADVLGINQSNVSRRLEKIDPERMFVVSPNKRKAIMTRLAESRGLEALAYITPEKLAASSAKDLMMIGEKSANVIQTLNQSKHKEVSAGRLENLMKMIEADCGVEDGEFEENWDEGSG